LDEEKDGDDSGCGEGEEAKLGREPRREALQPLGLCEGERTHLEERREERRGERREQSLGGEQRAG
jgi:hypothetical protein